MSEHVVTLGDLTVGYTAAGATDSRAVVLIHGLAEDRHSWREPLAHLRGFRLYAYDLRGHGETSLGAADGTLGQLASDLCAFLEQVTGPAVCIGFSLGGTVVLTAAAKRPDLVRSAVVIGTSTVVGRAAVGFYADRIARVESGDRDGIAQALYDDTAAGLHRADRDVKAVVRARVAAVGDGLGYANAARAMLALNEQPITPILSGISCPVTVVGGAYDAFCPKKAADIILSALPAATYVEIPDAGHLMNVDNPSAVTTVLTQALEGTIR